MRKRVPSLRLRRELFIALSLLPWVAAYALGTFLSGFTQHPPPRSWKLYGNTGSRTSGPCSRTLLSI
jgi:hypothetical protein